MAYFTKRYHPPGTPPGTLVGHAPVEAPLRITLIDYDKAEFVEKDLGSPAECQPYLTRPTTTWINLQGRPNPEQLNELGELFDIHPLALEDIMNTGQRSKVDIFERRLFIIMSLPATVDGTVTVQQVSFFVGETFIVSIHNGVIDLFAPIQKRLHLQANRQRTTPDFLLYSLLDVIVDQGFPVLEEFGDRLEDLEDELLEAPATATLSEIHTVKRELLLLRRSLWPQREVINALIRDEHNLISHETKTYLRDCYDHAIQIMDLLETYREMSGTMLDVYLSSSSNRLNDIMRVLTVIATIFIPLTFITGVYGMNFANSDSPWAMPELHWYFGYPGVWLFMIAVAVIMLIYFKRKNWL